MSTLAIVYALLLLLALCALVALARRRPPGRGRVTAIQVNERRGSPTHVYVIRQGDAGREWEVSPLYDVTPSSVERIGRLGLVVREERRDEDGRVTVYEA